MSETIDILKRLIHNEIEVQTFPATVKEVDKTAQTCKVQPVDNSPELTNVRLRASIEDTEQGHIVYPKQDSTVLVTLINNNPSVAFVSYVSEVDEVLIQLENDFKVASKNGEVQLNGDNKGALVVIADLVTKLNNLEEDLNNLKSIFGSWTPVSNDGGAALKTALTGATYIGNTFTKTTAADLENPKVKHGDGQ